MSSAKVVSDRDGRFVVPTSRRVATTGSWSRVGTMIKERRFAFRQGDGQAGRDDRRRRDPVQERLSDTGGRRGRLGFMSTSPWSPYRPSAAAPWNLERAWTLRRRAGFAATWAELERDLADGPDAGRRPRARRHVPDRGRPRRTSTRRPTCSATRPRLVRRAAAPGVVALPDALHARPAARAADADVARPLRHQPAQGRRRRGDARAERDVPPPRAAARSATCCARCSATRPC